jgi:16S rRNA (uracil1498-N3)-methyltransferase
MADRYFVDIPLPDVPVPDQTATVAGPEAHHLIHVMRAKPGDRVVLFDEGGAEFSAEVVRVGRADVELKITAREEIDRELPLEITLGVALPKGDRQRWLVEKATELGVKSFQPIVTRRTTVIPVEERMERRLERWGRVIISAMKQSGRAWRPRLTAPRELGEVLDSSGDRCIVWATPSGEILPGGDELRAQGNGTYLALVGPEGGWGEEEEEKLRSVPGWGVSLGPHRLRSETAVVTLLSLLLDRLISK